MFSLTTSYFGHTACISPPADFQLYQLAICTSFLEIVHNTSLINILDSSLIFIVSKESSNADLHCAIIFY